MADGNQAIMYLHLVFLLNCFPYILILQVYVYGAAQVVIMEMVALSAGRSVP